MTLFALEKYLDCFKTNVFWLSDRCKYYVTTELAVIIIQHTNVYLQESVYVKDVTI